MEETDKPFSSMQRFVSSAKEMLWKSTDQYGGSNNNSFETMVNISTAKNEIQQPFACANVRMLGYDLYKEGKMNVIIVKNLSSTARVFSEIKLFNASESMTNGAPWGFQRSGKLKRSTATYQICRSGIWTTIRKNKLVLSLVISSNMSILPKSVIVSIV